LVKFVAIARDSIRPGDFLFRLGGDEFCCLLPETTIAQAFHAGERVCGRIAAATVDVAGTPVKMTISIGVASTETAGYCLEALMQQADMAVYAAKRQGRNRVVAAGEQKEADSGKQTMSSGREPERTASATQASAPIVLDRRLLRRR
jgi:diguanylate cyclase (GGDEF)-like protein